MSLRGVKRAGSDSLSKAKKQMSKIKILSNPVKSFSDKKEYRLIELPNGLKSLLVQHFVDDDEERDEKHVELKEATTDEESGSEEEEDEDLLEKEKMAAVALCIKVGSFSDPQHIQGLAHFLEHMIFMGSRKFPKENEFDQFISSHGGANNALTECEYTMFYFEIVEEHLAGAIERFAQLFIEPLMLRDSMEREMEAVESEFQNNINHDDSRIQQLHASLANGPASTFTWGNLKTLKEGITNDELYSAVHAFRKKHYLASRMYLCVESAATLDEIQELVQENFSEIQDGPEPEPLQAPEILFKPEFSEKILYVKPKADRIRIYLTFLLPSLEKHYKSKPHDYLAFLIQHEGVGSLGSFLKKNLLALTVEAGSDDQSFEGNSLFTLFSIVISLTEEGRSRIDEILSALFSYLLLLKETPMIEHEKTFNELKQIRDTSFKYREEKTATDNVEELAVNMMYYDPADIINGSDVFFDFDSEITEKLIQILNEPSFNLLILTDKHEKYEKTEKWFGTEYHSEDISEKFINLWHQRALRPDDFSMPPRNEFICTNFDIISQDMDPLDLPQYPEKIFSNDIAESFFKLDAKFKLPHAFICLYIVSPEVVSSTRNMVLTSMFSTIVKHYMAEELYPATCAGLGSSIASEEKGMIIKLSGYNEKLPLLMDIITRKLRNVRSQMEEKVFEAYRKQYKKYCYNSLITSKFLNKECRLRTVEEGHKFFVDRFNIAGDIKFSDLLNFTEHFLDSLKLQILIQGNINKSTAMEVTNSIIANLNCEAIDGSFETEQRAAKIPPGTHVLRFESFLPEDKNSTTTTYIQLGSSTIRLQCLIEFVERLMEEPLFDILRTQEQLGYDVGCSHRFNHGILGISVTIQSQQEKNSTTSVDERVEKFLRENLLKIFEDLTDEEFETVQSSLIKLKNMVDVELETEVNRVWSEITSREYLFNRLELEAQMMARLTKKDVVEFFKSKILAENACKLSIQIVGTGSVPGEIKEDDRKMTLKIVEGSVGERQKLVTDFDEFVKSLEFYPVTKTVNDLLEN